MRFLALDYGQKRIGLAASDPLGLTAQPIGFLTNDGTLLSKLGEIVSEKEIDAFVIGYPRQLNGQPGPAAQSVERFAKIIEEHFGKPVHLWDERMTTAESEKALIQADVRRDKRKEVRDAMAASLLLQGFLQSRTVSS
jgi:putative Holliday junction resolvase